MSFILRSQFKNTAASSNCEAFMVETFDNVLANQKVGLVRADSDFYTEDLFNYIEGKELINPTAFKR